MNFQPSREIALNAAYQAAAEHVRKLDMDRFLATLFAPAPAQHHVFAIYAFNAEIARVRSSVSDPLPGEIRYQWWRDFLGGECHGDAGSNPVAVALRATISACALPIKPFLDLIEARTFDLYDDPMPTWLDCEGYCGESSSALIRLVCLALTGGQDLGGAETAGHAGVAFALTGMLRALPWTSRRGQLFLPRDMLENHGVAPADLRQGKDSPALRSALADVRARAADHLTQTRAQIAEIPAKIRPAFLPVCFVEPYLKAMEAGDYDPYRTAIDIPRLKKLFILWRQSRRARRCR